MNKSLYIFFGGFLGGLMRYLVGIFEKSLFGTWDYSILTVNLVGAFLLSTINYYAIKKKKIDRSSPCYIGLTTGFLGAFTSFSSLTKDLVLFSQESMAKGMVYLLLSLFGGYIMAILGSILGDKLARINNKFY